MRLHANELPWRAAADASEAGLNRYPEPHPLALAARLAQLYGWTAECGARLPRQRRGHRPADAVLPHAGATRSLITPAHLRHVRASARASRARRVIEVPLRREAGLQPRPARAARRADAGGEAGVPVLTQQSDRQPRPITRSCSSWPRARRPRAAGRRRGLRGIFDSAVAGRGTGRTTRAGGAAHAFQGPRSGRRTLRRAARPPGR